MPRGHYVGVGARFEVNTDILDLAMVFWAANQIARDPPGLYSTVNCQEGS